MASIPFTLAALATSAVPDLVVLGVNLTDEQDDSFRSAVITDGAQEYIVRIPRTELAEVRQSAELLGLAALTEGARSVLPFAIPETLGMTRAGDTRAVVSTLLSGAHFEVDDLSDDALLLQPIAATIAAIHNLPLSVAQNGGLPIRSAQDLRLQATRVIDRAEATRLLPQAVLDRWTQAVEATDLWDFTPTMVHGSLDADQLRISEDQITGVVGWSEFSVGDPATDFAWLLNAGYEVLEGVLARYVTLHTAGSLPQLRARAALYAELEIARWLFHGLDTHDDTIVNDAVGMLDRLVDSIGVFGRKLGVVQDSATLDEAGVSALLADTPEVTDSLSDTAAYEALDEDRMFGLDTDFVEPLRDSAEHLTEPVDDVDLPETPKK